jgi:hypothetical protein
MSNYNKQVATELYEEVKEELSKLPDLIKIADADGPLINIICDGLKKALAALRRADEEE